MRVINFIIRFLSLIKFLISVAAFCGVATYIFWGYGFLAAIHGTLLVWSVYVLCVPGAHGNNIIGFPYMVMTNEKILTEPYLWAFMALLNVVSFLFFPSTYFMTIPTHFLYSIIVRPFPSGIIFFTAFPGTFYQFLLGKRPYTATHILFRHLLIIAGTIAFIYFSQRHFVTIMGTAISA